MGKSIFGVGYLGLGNHNSVGDGKKIYAIWRTMLRRCYCHEYLRAHPNNTKSKVCKDWHNFQSFSQWFSENYPVDGRKYRFFKERANNVYSNKSCSFMPAPQENKKVACIQIKSPTGVICSISDLSKFCKAENLSPTRVSDLIVGKRGSYKGWSVVVV